MVATVTSRSAIDTLADLLERLGVPAERVRFHPAPGTATEADVVSVDRREDRLCELVEGVLVEKAMGLKESLLAGALIDCLRSFVIPRNLGLVSGEAGMMRLFPGLVRIPDVAFASWQRFPDGRVPKDPIPDVVPDLAIEVLSESNTPAEMTRKLGEYFSAGARLVWIVDPDVRTVAVHTAPGQIVVLGESDAIDGGAVLPGFSLKLRDLFSELDRQATPGDQRDE
jgi:Uma2 family endonuclease